MKTFSLIELVVVITVIGVLTPTFFSNISNIFKGSYDTVIRADLSSLAEIIETKALEQARKRGSFVPFYTASSRVGDSKAKDFNNSAVAGVNEDLDAFCACLPPYDGTRDDVECSTNTLPEAKALLEKYQADDVFFICDTNPQRSAWAAIIAVPDNGALGDLGEASGDINRDGDETDTFITIVNESGFKVYTKIFCVSSNNVVPIVWLASARSHSGSRGTLDIVNNAKLEEFERIIGGFVLKTMHPDIVRNGDLCQLNPSLRIINSFRPLAVRER